MEHTAEPWSVEIDSDSEEFFWIFSAEESEVAMISDGRIEDARRIVKCVNACAGIPGEVLKSWMNPPEGQLGAPHGTWAQQLAEMGRQRTELANAIRLTLDENGHLADGDVCTLKRLKDALAKIGYGGTAIEGHNTEITGG